MKTKNLSNDRNAHTFLSKVMMFFFILIITSIQGFAQTLSLQQCIDTALVYNRNIKLAQQDGLIAKEKNREAKSTLLPKIIGFADYRYYTNLPYQIMPQSAFGGPPDTYKEIQFGVPQNLSANLQIAMPLFNPSALSAIKTTRIANELSGIMEQKTDEDVVLEVSNAYYNAQILLNQLAFMDSNITNIDKLVQTTSLLNQQQLAKGTDVDRLKLQQEQLKTQRSTVFSQHQQVLNALKFLMGKPISDSIGVMLNENPVIEAALQGKITTDLLLIDKKMELSLSELSGLKNSRLPSLNAYGIYGSNGFGTTGTNSFFNFHPIGYVGAQLTIPLFNGMITRRKIDGKKIEVNKTIIQKELVAEKATLDKVNAEMQFNIANANIATVKTQIELAKKIYDNTLLQNEQGMATITDVLLADNSLREAQQNYIVSMVNLRKAELEYKRVTGNLISIKN
ncbi:MAG: outer membrane efflux protein [Bacteroidetes bacterium]|nr:MAG: outer membrane efflux protein [Bacteroidota bacterium]